MNYLLFNPLADNGNGEKTALEAKKKLKARFGEMESRNVLEINSKQFAGSLTKKDVLVLVGGDGTINHMANEVSDLHVPCDIYVYKAGTGNDFLRDVSNEIDSDGLLLINKYIKHLPKVTINGKTTLFINGIGFGIDGQVCEVADNMKAKGVKKISYPGISVKLALFKYKCPKATVKVDGKEIKYKRVWLASAMNGRFYGGGMMVAPSQDRLSNKLSMVCMHGGSRIKALIVFVGIFKGENVKHKEMVDIIEGKKIEVTFDHPCALQIDGETIRNVTSYVAEIE